MGDHDQGLQQQGHGPHTQEGLKDDQGALVLGLGFLFYAVRHYVDENARLDMQTFVYSIAYLMVWFALLLIDHNSEYLVNL